MEIWLSTHNDGKLREFKELLKGIEIDPHGAKELSNFDTPPEDGTTFVDNARIKTRALYSIKNTSWVVGDDSGLVVDGLAGLPGIHSARYAGPNAQSHENNAKLLKMMRLRAVKDRSAAFVCCLVVMNPQGEEFIFEGRLKGTIASAARGPGGFGYDPVFIPENEERTLSEMDPGEKNRISHRGQAMAQLLERLKESL